MLNKKLKRYHIIHIRAMAFVLLMAFLLSGLTLYTGHVAADQFDAKIKVLQRQNHNNQSAVDRLTEQASSYQDAINKLLQQINSLEQAIASNQQASNRLADEITVKQAELDHQKKVLGENIKTMYLEGQISTLEILAASKDLSEFVNKEVARNIVQSKIKDTVDQITELKLQLEQKQRELQARIDEEKDQQSELGATQAKQAQMLAYTEGQKSSFESRINKNNDRIAGLRAQQLAANQSLGGHVVAGNPNHGGYPSYLDNAAKDSLVDPWGMYNRECVSYTAWKVQQTFGHMPYWGGRGNANEWPGDARSAGIPTGSTPRRHSVAISTSGFYGHAMWVEAVSGNMIYVSQYNFDLAGHYSEMWVNGSNFTYLYFGS